jgi:hypothetical protein
MEEIKPQGAPTPTLSSLVDALQQMRDALTKASLLLQDLQFETDAPQRRSVDVASGDLMDRIKSL